MSDIYVHLKLDAYFYRTSKKLVDWFFLIMVRTYSKLQSILLTGLFVFALHTAFNIMIESFTSVIDAR